MSTISGPQSFVRNDWYMAAWASELADKPVARTIANEAIVLFRDAAGEVAALQDRCCHRGVALSLGRVVPEGLQCGYHGMTFAGNGQCVRIPGQDRIPSKACVRHYAVEERDSIVWLWLGDPGAADRSSILSYPYHGDSANWPHKQGYLHVKAGYEMLLDNLMDATHLGYVHTRTIGGGNAADHSNAITKTERTPTGVHYTRWLLNTQPPPTYTKGAGLTGPIDRWQDMELIAPCSVVLFNGGVDVSQKAHQGGSREGGFTVRMLNCTVPETDTTSHYFFSVANGYGQDDPVNTELLFNDVVATFLEDQAICENQQANMLRYPDPPLVDIKSDEARIMYRRHLDRRLAEERQQP